MVENRPESVCGLLHIRHIHTLYVALNYA